ncbi:metal-transporting ATPase [Tetragenococcus osmophilus]|uniref:Metal-transporting ATPase n=2 Tax=Tetragenococcus osmophilus TaxID=526944 RepID=A0AA38CZ84_9ENTE|nr:heavy metal translocating P-type ATPase [Tetragenococcus osmophilus]GMA72955.1 metal-transporting ATPase [Tetragenococcus osmophilus]
MDKTQHIDGHNSKENASQSQHAGHLPGEVLMYFIGLIIYLLALFVPFAGATSNYLFTAAVVLSGFHVIVEGVTETIKNTKEKRKFQPNVHLLMTLAVLGAMLIGNFDESALLILIFAGAHFLEEFAEEKSQKEITSLLQMNPTKARLLQADGSTKMVDVQTLTIGDQLKVLPGDQIATDGFIVEGQSTIDESSINGESMPKEKGKEEEVFASTINGQGTFTMEVSKDSSETVFAKILSVVEQSQSYLPQTATKIQKIEPIYVKSVLLIVPLFVLLMPVLLQWSWETSIYRGIVLLITASPCALAVSVVPATLSAISNLAKKGVLFKGGAYLTNLVDIKAVAFDKTGTLTQGQPVVTDSFYKEEAMKSSWQQIIVTMEKSANHPLAKAILAAYGQTSTVEMSVKNEIGQGIIGQYNGRNYRIGKPSLFQQVSPEMQEKTNEFTSAGKTVVYFSEDEEVVALIAFMDRADEKAAATIAYLKEQNINTLMITGDAKSTGDAVAHALGVDEVFSNILPENKAEAITSLQTKYGKTAMVGDGINDAPALVKADVGFAMGEGTDVAIDVADAVIMQNDLIKFEYAHKLSQKLNHIVWQNIIFAMGLVLLLSGLNIIGQMNIGLGVLAHEGSTLIVLVNGLRLLLPLKKVKKAYNLISY